MSLKIDVDMYKILGIPDPTIGDPTLASGSQLSDYPTVFWKNLTDWCKENRILLALIGVGLVILFVGFRR